MKLTFQNVVKLKRIQDVIQKISMQNFVMISLFCFRGLPFAGYLKSEPSAHTERMLSSDIIYKHHLYIFTYVSLVEGDIFHQIKFDSKWRKREKIEALKQKQNKLYKFCPCITLWKPLSFLPRIRLPAWKPAYQFSCSIDGLDGLDCLRLPRSRDHVIKPFSLHNTVNRVSTTTYFFINFYYYSHV